MAMATSKSNTQTHVKFSMPKTAVTGNVDFKRRVIHAREVLKLQAVSIIRQSSKALIRSQDTLSLRASNRPHNMTEIVASHRSPQQVVRL